jgi:hypothetical protein
MRIVLSSEISVSRVAVFAEMAWMERRPELGLLCRAASDAGNSITTAVVQTALPGLADAGAHNIIAWCRMLGLCDTKGALTSLGQDVAVDDEAPVPEQGVYGLWLTQHPVLGRRVLAVERLTSNREQRSESIEPLALEPDPGKVFCSVVDPRERFIVRSFGLNRDQPGAVRCETRATCYLRWTLDFDQERDHWQLDGMIEAPQGNGKHVMCPLQHTPESEQIDLWSTMEIIAPSLRPFGEWDSTKRRLAVSAFELKNDEVRSFRRTFTVPLIALPGKGQYQNATVTDVPIGPRTASDAQQWAMARFDQELAEKPAYRSRATVRARFAELSENTPLEECGVTFPAHDDLLAHAASDRARYWSLAAPVDLSPYPATPEELGPMRVGAPGASPSPMTATCSSLRAKQ